MEHTIVFAVRSNHIALYSPLKLRQSDALNDLTSIIGRGCKGDFLRWQEDSPADIRDMLHTIYEHPRACLANRIGPFPAMEL